MMHSHMYESEYEYILERPFVESNGYVEHSPGDGYCYDCNSNNVYEYCYVCGSNDIIIYCDHCGEEYSDVNSDDYCCYWQLGANIADEFIYDYDSMMEARIDLHKDMKTYYNAKVVSALIEYTDVGQYIAEHIVDYMA